jgi:DNA-directed RNA polymerase specialized sigma24 family protein
MTPGSEAASRLLMEQVGQTVRAALRRRSGLSLSDDDSRAENLDALDVYQDALTRVWERLAGRGAGDTNVADLKAYATTVAYNLWSDYLRQRNPRRTSLKNRLRYFLSHAPDYAIWEGPDSALSCGLRAWRYGNVAADQARIQWVRDDPSWLPPQAKSLERYSVGDWNRFALAAFARLGGAVAFDDLVSLAANVLQVREDRTDSLDADGDGDPVIAQLADPARRTPDFEVELRGSIARLWGAVRELRADYRCAYLLNIPGPGKSRGDIEVFADLGVARVGDIGAVLGLSESQYAIAWDALDLSPADRVVASLATAEEKFSLLWKYLPLGDALIARLLGIQQQHVINRRTIALRELARALSR